ncbi:MAG: diguanylate cyclase [Lachnospiraceae bacterium]|nr:diguanylate cyclase [Lachnospiraceae bacterium]
MLRQSSKEHQDKVLLEIYGSSVEKNLITMLMVVVIEVLMMGYSFLNSSMYGGYLWRHRFFYIVLIILALTHIGLLLYIQKDMPRRYKWMNYSNPLLTAFFFIWALCVTASEAQITGSVDVMVFMTFSLAIPMCFYLTPEVYVVISLAADLFMLYISALYAGSVGMLINLTIFLIFQFVLGTGFLELKRKLAERLVEEQDKAENDVLTGLGNRRRYVSDLRRLEEARGSEDWVYISLDVNSLKEVNDRYGHEEGDKLLEGAARCLEHTFSSYGHIYRVGGDEFVMLLLVDTAQLLRLFQDYEKSMEKWSALNGLPLTTSYGYVRKSEFPGYKLDDLAEYADKKMYEAKDLYYQRTGKNRRRY